MPRPRSDGLLDRLRAEADSLADRIKQEEEREKARKAADDHRRWLLAGQCAVGEMLSAPDGEVSRKLLALLDAHARSAADRALFGLPSAKPLNGKDASDASH